MKEKNYKMGEILDILKTEYPGISASALRFWQKEGLIEPSGEETSGHHRRYREKDLDIIRFVKDLSGFGYSLNHIKQELFSVKERIESKRRGKIESALYSTTYVAKILMHHRSRKRLAMKIKLYRDMDESARHLPIFERSILEKRIEHNTPGYFIRKMDRLRITKPEEDDERFLYSSCDEVILETLTYILEEEKDFLERCQKFISAVQYLHEEIGATARFAAKPVMSLDLSTYKALLYNLIQERFSYEENEKKKKKKKRKSNELSRFNCKDS